MPQAISCSSSLAAVSSSATRLISGLQLGGHGGLGHAQGEAERDQALLGAVVQVALDAAAGGDDDPGPGGGELGAALGVGDRGADEFGEAGHALFGVGREVLAPRPDGDRAPQAPLNEDGSRDPRSDSHPADGVTGRAGRCAG